MMGNYALIKSGKVINTVVWDGQAEVDFGDGVTTVELDDSQVVNIGYAYKDGNFTAPPPTQEEIDLREGAARSSNVSSKEYLMAEASQRISVLQDAVDLEMATDEEAAALPLWKKYRVLLSRVDANTADEIEWPAKPE